MIYAAIALAALGGVILILAIRGRRIDTHPICQRCGFDLIGTCGAGFQPARPARQPPQQPPHQPPHQPSHDAAPADPPPITRCPECGGNLAHPRAIRIGHRKVRRRMMLAAVFLLLAGLLPAGLMVWGSATGVDWNTYKPEWWLMADARAGGRAADGALRELDGRLRDGRLSRERALAITQLAMAHQQDESRVWSAAWGEVLESARRAELLAPEQLEAYLQSIAAISLQMRPRMAQAVPWRMELHLSQGRIAPRNDIDLRIATAGLWVNDQKIDDRTLVRAIMGLGGLEQGMTAFNYGSPRLLALSPGEYDIRLRMRFTAVDTARDEATIGEWDEEFTSRLHIVGPGQPVIELVDDESLEQMMVKSIKVEYARLSADGSRGEGAIILQSPPVDVVFDIFWRFEDESDPEGWREIRMGGISARAGEEGIGRYSRLLDADIPPRRIDIILRPSFRAPGSRIAHDRIWGGRITIPDIPITAADDRETP